MCDPTFWIFEIWKFEILKPAASTKGGRPPAAPPLWFPMWLCGCVAMRLCGHVAMWPCGELVPLPLNIPIPAPASDRLLGGRNELKTMSVEWAWGKNRFPIEDSVYLQSELIPGILFLISRNDLGLACGKKSCFLCWGGPQDAQCFWLHLHQWVRQQYSLIDSRRSRWFSKLAILLTGYDVIHASVVWLRGLWRQQSNTQSMLDDSFSSPTIG